MSQLALSPFTPAPPARRERRRLSIGLWLPVTPIVLLAAPLIMIGAPFARLSRTGRKVSSVRLAWATGALLLSLSGLVIAVEAPAARVRITIF